MEMFVRCGRCGALTETSGETVGGSSAQCATCVVMTRMSSGDVAVSDGSEYTVLCPDCIGQLKAWLAGESEEQRKPQASTDSAGKLVRDMARVFCCMHEGTQPFACWYFDHVKCDGCPAYGHDHGCDQEMYNDIGRRAFALGIHLVGGTEDGK